ncbi:glycosyltransferase [Akkermansiaceae bacterium]|nr:glycosyltransferase [Akkermansiaceae bacterium]MDB4500560.1 glycosyltransferase [Akkermansiaceae bacterium]MDB4507976.1 glycosyltransferase [Akkermansiaceae bacterium]
MKICVASPYPLSELKGNSVTTRRIVDILNEAGFEARGSHEFDGAPADVLISLHAFKGEKAVLDFQRYCPDGKVIVLITGTDLYVDLPEGRGLSSLETADAIAITHEEARASMPSRFYDKLHIVPSCLAVLEIQAKPDAGKFVISVVGHLRSVKRSFLTIESVAKHPEWDVEVWQIGEALDEEMSDIACDWEEADSRYKWLGGLPREESLEICSRSSLTVNSSFLEGGANAVLEAMTMGVPILASRIEGNVGLLGRDYPGYFEGEDIESKLVEVMAGKHDLDDWASLAEKRLPLFSRESEKTAWEKVIEDVN